MSGLSEATNDFLVFQWESKVQRCQKEFDDISAEIKREMERFEINRARDFKTTIIKYLQEQMAHQQQVCFFFLNAASSPASNSNINIEI